MERLIARYDNPVLIYNPMAGKLRRSGMAAIDRVVSTLDADGMRVGPVATTAPGSATDIARRELAQGADLIIAAGGDGTINEVLNGMVPSRVPLAILPGGTANCLAMELGLGTNIDKASRRLRECTPERIAVGRLRNELGERYFLLMAGVGLDAHIVYHVRAGFKNLTGKLAYWVGGLKALTSTVTEFDTMLEKTPQRTGFALASRIRNYGGDLSIARNASLLSNEFETVLFRGTNPVRYWGYFLGIATRTLPGFPGVKIARARKLEFKGSSDRRIYVQVDGEFAGPLPAKVEIVDDAVSLMIPSDFRERLGVRIGEVAVSTVS